MADKNQIQKSDTPTAPKQAPKQEAAKIPKDIKEPEVENDEDEVVIPQPIVKKEADPGKLKELAFCDNCQCKFLGLDMSPILSRNVNNAKKAIEACKNIVDRDKMCNLENGACNAMCMNAECGYVGTCDAKKNIYATCDNGYQVKTQQNNEKCLITCERKG